MPWVEVFAVFVVCHLTGDYLLQTEWQAMNKRGGLGEAAVNRRALFSHAMTYTLAFVPALVWLADDLGAGALAVAALITLPHVIQDDGRLLAGYMRSIKHTEPVVDSSLLMAVDQCMHIAALFLLALVVGA